MKNIISLVRQGSLRYNACHISFYSTKVYSNKSAAIPHLIQKQHQLGKVILLNGTSSVGKTTFSNELTKYGFYKISYDDIYYQKMLNFLLNSSAGDAVSEAQRASITEEDIHRSFCGYKIMEGKYREYQLGVLNQLKLALIPVAANFGNNIDFLNDDKMFKAAYDQVEHMLYSGQNVVVDMVLDKEQITVFHECFQYYRHITTVLLYSSLVESLNKCYMRNSLSYQNDSLDYRYPENIINNYCDLYNFVESHNVLASDIVLEESINKKSTLTALAKVKGHQRLLLSYLYDDAPPEIFTQQMSKTLEASKKAEDMMKLDGSEKITVTSSVESDFVIYNNLFGDNPELFVDCA